jgi:hypothetical protein
MRCSPSWGSLGRADDQPLDLLGKWGPAWSTVWVGPETPLHAIEGQGRSSAYKASRHKPSH